LKKRFEVFDFAGLCGLWRSGDAINAVLATAAYNFCRLIAWLWLLLLQILLVFRPVVQLRSG